MANVFPKWANWVPLKLAIGIGLTVATISAGVYNYFTPEYTEVGYQPKQPIAFSHALHVEQLGMDCRYCHTYVDRSEHSNVPATSTCMNCHSQVKARDAAGNTSPNIQQLEQYWNSGEPIPWVRIHRTPDYVYFNHMAHVNRGISCVHCHGQVNEMEEVYQAKSLSMAFCLECHRNAEDFIRPNEHVFDLNWEYETPEKQREEGTKLVHDWKVAPPQQCSGCHR